MLETQKDIVINLIADESLKDSDVSLKLSQQCPTIDLSSSLESNVRSAIIHLLRDCSPENTEHAKFILLERMEMKVREIYY